MYVTLSFVAIFVLRTFAYRSQLEYLMVIGQQLTVQAPAACPSPSLPKSYVLLPSNRKPEIRGKE